MGNLKNGLVSVYVRVVIGGKLFDGNILLNGNVNTEYISNSIDLIKSRVMSDISNHTSLDSVSELIAQDAIIIEGEE